MTAATIRWLFLLLCTLFFCANFVYCDEEVELSKADNALFEALKDENIEAANAALQSGANINIKSPRGEQTPLMQSVLHGRTKMVAWALEHGADTTIGERDGYTPMHGAGFQGRKDIAELLLKAGVSVRDVHEDGHEPASKFL